MNLEPITFCVLQNSVTNLFPSLWGLIVKYLSYRKVSDISRTLEGNNIVDQSDVIGASPVGAAPTSSSFST